MNKLQGDFSPLNGKVAVIVSRFNGFVVESLLSGAINTLERHGVANDDIDVIYVPGAFEIPLTAQAAAESAKYVAVIALGAIIRGATPHFDIVANESAKGLSQVALKYSIPMVNGILTTNTIEQAIERSGTKAGNKGAEAAVTAIEMVNLLGHFK